MRPLYHEIDHLFEVYTLHLHKYLECIYVTEGTMSLFIGKKRIEMKPHDLAIIFPDTLHQFYVDEQVCSSGIYLLGTPAQAGSFAGILQKYNPRRPVIPGERIHPDIPYALNTLLCSESDPYYFDLQQAYFQILLARAFPICDLEEKTEQESLDLVERAVSYISEHFTEPISLTGMARELCTSPYVLSRFFSGTLKTSFNQYLNEIRLDYASHLLHATDKSVTDILMDSGFSSQTTFNRAFRNSYHMTPREYRRQSQNKSDELRKQLSEVREPPGTVAGLQNDVPWKVTKGRFL